MKRSYLILLVILLAAAVWHLLPIAYSDIAFNYDTAGSWLEVRDIIRLKKLRLVGGEGGIKGIFFGPTWHYLLAGAFWITGGDPRGGALLSALINLSCIPLAWLIGRRVNQLTGILAAWFFAWAPIMIGSSSYQFVVNAFPFINLVALWLLNRQPGKWPIIALVFWGGLSFHFEPVVAIGFNLAIGWLIFQRLKTWPWRQKLSLTFAWIIPFIPQLMFDLRHNWLQTRAIINFIREKGQGLGGSLPLWQRLGDRPYLLIKHFSQNIAADNIWLAGLLLILIVLGLKTVRQKGKKTERQLAKQLIVLLIIPLLYYIFIFPPGIKNWYYASFPAVYGLIFALGLAQNWKNKRLKYLTGLTLIIFCVNAVFYSGYLTKIKQGFPSNDPSSLKNQLAVVNWIYQDAASQSFNVYTFSPAIYDKPWQYLLWYQADKNQLALPQDFSYQPQTYDYVPNKLKYVPAPKPNDSIITYLIFEPHNPAREISYTPEDFIQPFSRLSIVEEKNFPGNLRVEKRQNQE